MKRASRRRVSAADGAGPAGRLGRHGSEPGGRRVRDGRGPRAELDRAADGTRAGACGRHCDRSRAVGRGRRHDCRRRHDSGYRSRRHCGPGSRGAVERTDSIMTKRLVVAYGGSLESAAAMSALAARLDADLATLTLDVGQGMDLEQVRDQARAAGARRAHVVDARRELAAQILRPALTAGAFEAGPRAVAITRPVIAAHLVAVARMEGATDVAHGATGGDRVRIERLIADLAPELVVHATAGAAGHEPAPRIDQNLWGRTVTLGEPADHVGRGACRCVHPDPRAAYAAPRSRPSSRSRLSSGVPVAVNGVPLDIDELVEVVDTIAGDHGVGRFDSRVGVLSRAGGGAGGLRVVGRDCRVGVGQLRPRYAGVARPHGAGLRRADRRRPVAHAGPRRPRRVHGGLGRPPLRRRPPAAVARRVPRGWPAASASPSPESVAAGA